MTWLSTGLGSDSSGRRFTRRRPSGNGVGDEAWASLMDFSNPTDGEEALAACNQHHPDVVLMDVRMPRLNGLEALRRLAGLGDSTKVLILTTFDLDEYVYEALRDGASGFLLKDVRPAQLIEAVRGVTDGDALLAPSVTRRLIEKFMQASRLPLATAAQLGRLTPRESGFSSWSREGSRPRKSPRHSS